MERTKHRSTYFYGNKISDYGLQCGYLDYSTLAKAFDAVLNNDIISRTEQAGFYWELENCFIDNTNAIEELQEKVDTLRDNIEAVETLQNAGLEADLDLDELTAELEELEEELDELEYEDDMPNFCEIFQYYIVSDQGADIIREYTSDPLYYCEELDMWVWGVTHWGTAWSHVLTSVRLELDAE